MKRITVIIMVMLALAASLAAADVTESRVVQDEDGWRFLVNGEVFPIYGMVWSYTPAGYDSSYSLWDKDPAFIKETIDTDMSYLKKMGVNMIRCFDDVPPEWIEYIYHEYGITSMINNLLGRYGVTVDGIWYPVTDYSDRHTQETLIEMAAESALRYKDTDGVVMYMLGNESNYGLVWEGYEIQDLPTENQNAIKAGYLYDLLEKAMQRIKEIDPDRVVGFINGDIQNMELIAELCPSIEVFGVNIYRGGAFGDGFYDTVASTIDRPILVTESGSDAYNARIGQEDQWMQAYYIQQQWYDIFMHSYGKGRHGNILGAFVFEWLDEWWKIYQYKDLDIHNTEATWGNAGYDIDYVPGGNNMNEEWFGIAAQGVDDGFIAKRVPRAAYYMLSDIFAADMTAMDESAIADLFSSLDMDLYLARGNANTLGDKIDAKTGIWLENASILTEMTMPLPLSEGTVDGFDGSPKARAEGEITIAADVFERFSGSITLNAWTDQPTYLLEDVAPYYNDYHLAVNTAKLSYTGNMLDITGHYHGQIGGFSNMGDVFTLVPDQYDNTTLESSPTGIEIVGKEQLEGLRIVGGTEIYDGAAPQVVAGYNRYFPGNTVSWYVSGIGGIEYDPSPDIPGQGKVNLKGSLSAAMYADPWIDLQLSVMSSGNDKVGLSYLSDDGTMKKIDALDTIGAQLLLETKMLSHLNLFAKADYRGLVAESQDPDAVSYLIYTDGGEGNRIQGEAGATFTYGSHSLTGLVRYRTPLEKPMGRDKESPFRVTGNKETAQMELAYVYDQEGLTNFYAWNRDDIEGSMIAGGVALLYSFFEGAEDNMTWQDPVSGLLDAGGAPRVSNTFEIRGNLVLNPAPGLRIAAHGGMARQMANKYGDTYILNSFNAGIDVRWGKLLLKTDFSVDSFGPEQWQEDQGIAFPYQWMVDLRYGFNTPALLDADNSIGIRWDGVVFGDHSLYGDRYYETEIGKVMTQVTIYYDLSW